MDRGSRKSNLLILLIFLMRILFKKKKGGAQSSMRYAPLRKALRAGKIRREKMEYFYALRAFFFFYSIKFFYRRYGMRGYKNLCAPL